jgi:cell division protease FtsH
MRHFDDARDRVMMGQRRESLVLSEREKQLTAYHEAGHAVTATVLPNADPIHKVTILPIGMALGVTQQLPAEERHSYDQTYLEERLIVFMGGRMAEELVFGVVSTGANNDLVSATELARKMVREWGMSDRIGPMAWGSQGMVFLGEDLMHTRDYSDETARVIDEEVEKLLREMEKRCRDLLIEHRNGLDLVARALLEHETIDGAQVTRLIDIGDGTGAASSVGTAGTAGAVGTVATVATDTTRPLSSLPAPPPLPPVDFAPNPSSEPASGMPLRFDDPLQG